MQVDPIKPRLKAPRTNRLEVEYDALLSNFAFNFNLRRYNVGAKLGRHDLNVKQLGARTETELACFNLAGDGRARTLLHFVAST